MMEFRIADTFTDSLTRLTRDEQKAVKTAAFDLQMNPASPGLSFHRLEKSKDKNFWSVRVGSDVRLIVHKTISSFLLCYVDHHDRAYSWAERRKLETHPKTGAAQFVEIRERVEEIAVPVYVEVPRPKPPSPPLFANLTDEVLLGYGVPLEWLADVRQATEDSILYEQHFGHPKIASAEVVRRFMTEAAKVADLKFSLSFLLGEWEDLVDAWQLQTWESYRDVKRLGRKTRLQESQRVILWGVLDAVRGRLHKDGFTTHAEICTRLASQLESRKHPPFEFVVVDEAQDLSVSQLKFLAALGGKRPNSLFFAGDLGQRIFQQPFSWKSLGVDIRGRARTLHINYRTSPQIRMQTDRLLGPEVADVDGNTEDRRGTVSVFNGPVPAIRIFKSQEEENDAVGAWLAERSREGVMPHEFGVFVRSDAELERARAVVAKAALPSKMLDEHVETTSGQISIGTMHLAKGLEFRAVVVMACDDEIIPLQSRIETVADDSDREEIYNTERNLLYVACTRARDHLLVTSVEPASEFLDDMKV